MQAVTVVLFRLRELHQLGLGTIIVGCISISRNHSSRNVASLFAQEQTQKESTTKFGDPKPSDPVSPVSLWVFVHRGVDDHNVRVASDESIRRRRTEAQYGWSGL